MRSIEISLSAIKDNYLAIKQKLPGKKVVAVVKANAYGHGMHEVASALESIGVDALATADLSEALELRAAGIKSRLMCWLVLPDDEFSQARELGVEVGVSNFEVLNAVPDDLPIHIKVDTGLGRNGFVRADWDKAFELAASKRVVGIFSHLANTNYQEDLKQRSHFDAACLVANEKGLTGFERHLSASEATFGHPDFDYEMVRVGIMLYGLNPNHEKPVTEIELQPAMRVTAKVAGFKRVQAGQGVSYGYRYVAERATNLVLVPFGYAEGMPRISEGLEVVIQGKRYPIVGRVAMDQFVVDVSDAQIPLGTEVVIFGDPIRNEPCVQEVAESAGTVNYEIVTRIGGRANRVYLDK